MLMTELFRNESTQRASVFPPTSGEAYCHLVSANRHKARAGVVEAALYQGEKACQAARECTRPMPVIKSGQSIVNSEWLKPRTGSAAQAIAWSTRKRIGAFPQHLTRPNNCSIYVAAALKLHPVCFPIQMNIHWLCRDAASTAKQPSIASSVRSLNK